MAKRKTTSTPRKPRSKATSQTQMKKKRKIAATKAAGRYRLRRILLLICGVLLIIWGIAWLALSQLDMGSPNPVKDYMTEKASQAGLKISQIVIEGNTYTNEDVVRALLNVQKGDPLFALDPKAAQEKLEQIKWVRSARVERRLPDRIYIHLEEYEPAALWFYNDALAVIDAKGQILADDNLSRFQKLPLLRGAGAHLRAKEFLSWLTQSDVLRNSLDHAILIEEKRWDMVLKNGLIVKLPRNNVDEAIRALDRHHNADGILTKDIISVVDARYKGRFIVKTKLGKVQDYKTETDGQ